MFVCCFHERQCKTCSENWIHVLAMGAEFAGSLMKPTSASCVSCFSDRDAATAVFLMSYGSQTSAVASAVGLIVSFVIMRWLWL